MKTMVMWSAKPGAVRDAVKRFLATQGAPPAGLTILGRWHSVDLSAGFTLYEYTDPAALYEGAAQWSDLLDLKNYIVVEDAQAAPVLAKVYGA